MQKIAMKLLIGRICVALILCGLVVYFFARPWTPFWVDMLVGIVGAGVALWGWARKPKKSNATIDSSNSSSNGDAV